MNPIKDGIKSLAIGKKGSRDLTSQQVEDIVSYKLNESDQLDRVQEAIFLTTLFYKGITKEEEKLHTVYPATLFNDANHLMEHLNINIDFSSHRNQNILHIIRALSLKLLEKQHLTEKEAYILGSFYFNTHDFLGTEYDILRVISVFILRIRHSSTDEYAGLYDAFMDQIHAHFKPKKEASIKKQIIQIAEPFDGNERSFLLTPIIVQYLQDQGFSTLSLCGESSGPKYGVNVLQLATALNKTFLSNTEEISTNLQDMYLDIASISPCIQYWIELRRKMLKRPYMATLEKFPNISGAFISITSAFHKAFSDKMIALGEKAGFIGNIVVRKGREGSLAFSLSKPVEIDCSVKLKNNTYKRHHFEFSLKDLGLDFESDGRYDISLEKNVSFIKKYLLKEDTKHPKEELRVQLTLKGLEKAVSWICQESL